MKFLLAIAALAASVSGHAIMQKLSVNGQDQGQLKGVWAPTSDYPLYSPNDANFACNTGIVYKDTNVISIPAGAKVGAWWGHVIGYEAIVKTYPSRKQLIANMLLSAELKAQTTQTTR